jgi:endo-1,4-beta-xylanase
LIHVVVIVFDRAALFAAVRLASTATLARPVLGLLRRLKEKKAPIHGFGTQAHLSAGSLGKIKAETVRKFFGQVAGLGLKILITELDVIDADLPDDIERRDKGVAETYEAYLSAALQEKAVVAVLTWGLTDKYTWLARRHKRPSGVPIRVLPLDAQYGRKPAWQAVAKAIDATSRR